MHFAAVLIYVASIPVEDLTRVGALGSLAKATGALLIASALLAVAAGELRIRRTDTSLVIFGAFVAWVACSYFWSSNQDNTLERVITYVQLFAVTIVIWQHLGTAARLRIVLQAFVAGCFIGSLYAILVKQPHDPTGVARYSVGGPNSFGLQIVFALVASYYLARTSQRWWAQALYAAFAVVGIVEVFYTASRTALVALVLAALITFVERSNLRPRVMVSLAVIAIVAAVGVSALTSSSQLDRLGSFEEGVSSGFDGRFTQWHLAVDVFRDHPVFGAGANVLRDYSENETGVSKVAHNSFLGVAADLGFVGLGLFIGMFLAATNGLSRLRPKLKRLWLGLMTVWLVGAMTLTWEQLKFTFFVLVMVAAQRALTFTTDAEI